MLLSFSVENFRSFRGGQTLNLLALKRLGGCQDSPHCQPLPGTDQFALRVASLYGPNGAGKSNLVRAISSAKRLVLHGTPIGKRTRYQPFLLDSETLSKPTCFEFQFTEAGRIFRYGFSYDAERVREEWLDTYEGTKERNLFSRRTAEDDSVLVELGTATKGQGLPFKIEALAKVGARPNQLFLTEVVNLGDPAAQGPDLSLVVRWFESRLSIIEPDDSFPALASWIAADMEFARFASDFVREAGTGIATLDVTTTTLPRAKPPGNIPAGVWKTLVQDLSPGQVMTLPSPEGGEVLLEGSEGDAVIVRSISALHAPTRGKAVRLSLNEESDGTQRLLTLLPALYRITQKNEVFVIDELERSMHPVLAKKFVEFFLKVMPGTGSQLIFTTHESTLLDLELVRRDGIWFAEKDPEGATQLYSLADFRVRNDLKIEKGYLQGRFGAVPFLGGIDHLIEEQANAERQT